MYTIADAVAPLSDLFYVENIFNVMGRQHIQYFSTKAVL